MRPATHWTDAAASVLPDLITLRRAIHAEPELGLHNPKTRAKIEEALLGLPLEYKSGPSTTGLLAVLHTGRPGRTLLLRADTDALPLTEDTGLPFSSNVKGSMHACGHDGHTAMLVGAARLLCERKEELTGSVVFMFQPGEEGYHGARFMLEDGLLDPLPDAAFALHIMPNAPHGIFSSRPGPLLASTDKIFIDITGRGGHASMPHDALDPFPIACEIGLAIQSFVTRQVSVFDPAVVTIGKIEAGSSDNIIPDTVSMLGTIRTMSADVRQHVQTGLRRLIEGIAAAHGATADVRVVEGFPVTVCDARAVTLSCDVTRKLYSAGGWIDMAAPLMGGEDFSYVLEKIPGAMIFLGAAREDDDWRSCCGLHSNKMILDEAVMEKGVALLAAIAEEFLDNGF